MLTTGASILGWFDFRAAYTFRSSHTAVATDSDGILMRAEPRYFSPLTADAIARILALEDITGFVTPHHYQAAGQSASYFQQAACRDDCINRYAWPQYSRFADSLSFMPAAFSCFGRRYFQQRTDVGPSMLMSTPPPAYRCSPRSSSSSTTT